MKLSKLPYYALSSLGFYRKHIVDLNWNNQNDSPFYIIRRANRWGEAGFFSNYFYALSHYAYALQKGWKPVIDMRNYKTLYSEHKGVNGEQNAWNYYFRQPYTTQDAYNSGHFILSNCFPPRGFNPIHETDSVCELNPDTARALSEIAQNDLSIRPDLVARFKTEFNSLFAGKRILGIHYRGGDKRTPPPGHRHSISEENLLLALDEMMNHPPDAIFLATDEEGISDLLKSRTSLPVVQLPACRLPSGLHEGLHLQIKPVRRPMHRYLLGLEVLRDAWFLSRCDSLIYGHSNVSSAALFLRGRPYLTKMLIASGPPA